MYRLIACTAARQDRQYSHLLERLDHADQQHQEVVALHAEFLRTITRELQVPTLASVEVSTRSAVRSPAESAVREVCTEQYPLASAAAQVYGHVLVTAPCPPVQVPPVGQT